MDEETSFREKINNRESKTSQDFSFKTEAKTFLVEIHRLEHKARNLVKFNLNIKKSRITKRLNRRCGKRKGGWGWRKLPEIATSCFSYQRNESIHGILLLNKHSILN